MARKKTPPPIVVPKAYRKGGRVRVTKLIHTLAPVGTEAKIVKVRPHAQGLGGHLYLLDLDDRKGNLYNTWFRHDELEKV